MHTDRVVATVLQVMICFMICATSCIGQRTNAKTIIRPILIEKETYSGLHLKRVTNPSDPERILFQKMLYSGEEIMVFVVASETKTAVWKDYGMEEFIHVLNGRARLNPDGAEERYYRTGDSFIAPKGYNGEWETQGGEQYFYELSVIKRRGSIDSLPPGNRIPVGVDPDLLSGIGITKMDSSHEAYRDDLYRGVQLDMTLHAEAARTIDITGDQKEQLVQIVAGTLTLTESDGEQQTFYKDDWFILPRGYTGQWESKGHHLLRYLSVTRADVIE